MVTGVGSTSFHWRGRSITLPLTGRFNVSNALMAATVATVLGVDEDHVVEGLALSDPVPGRMEVVAAEDPFSVHRRLRPHAGGTRGGAGRGPRPGRPGPGALVFGCGGDRDQGKRPEMGAVSSRLSDVVVLTSDNPRSEDPLAIIEQIRGGLRAGADVVVEPDRAEAIRLAVGMAGAGDVVLLAGKGHETTQSAAGHSRPFDDRVRGQKGPRAGRSGGTTA